MPFDREVFFDTVRENPFPGHLNQEQVDGMNLVLSPIPTTNTGASRSASSARKNSVSAVARSLGKQLAPCGSRGSFNAAQTSLGIVWAAAHDTVPYRCGRGRFCLFEKSADANHRIPLAEDGRGIVRQRIPS